MVEFETVDPLLLRKLQAGDGAGACTVGADVLSAAVDATADVKVARVRVDEDVHDGPYHVFFGGPDGVVETKFCTKVPLRLLVADPIDSCLQLPVLVRAALLGRVPQFDQLLPLLLVHAGMLCLGRPEERVQDGHLSLKRLAGQS